jgi:hypothetical protein
MPWSQTADPAESRQAPKMRKSAIPALAAGTRHHHLAPPATIESSARRRNRLASQQARIRHLRSDFPERGSAVGPVAGFLQNVSSTLKDDGSGTGDRRGGATAIPPLLFRPWLRGHLNRKHRALPCGTLIRSVRRRGIRSPRYSASSFTRCPVQFSPSIKADWTGPGLILFTRRLAVIASHRQLFAIGEARQSPNN